MSVALPLRITETGSRFEVMDDQQRLLLVVPFSQIEGRFLARAEAARLVQAACLAIAQAHALPTSRDEEIDGVLSEFDGDPRAAISGLLHDLETLARDAERVVSRRFVRGQMFRAKGNSWPKTAVKSALV